MFLGWKSVFGCTLRLVEHDVSTTSSGTTRGLGVMGTQFEA